MIAFNFPSTEITSNSYRTVTSQNIDYNVKYKYKQKLQKGGMHAALFV